jgi:hypothetical protein
MEKEKMIQRVAKELASEIVMVEKNPSYKPVLNRNECIKKLCTIYNEDFSSLSEKFDYYVDKYKKNPDILSL